MNRIGVVCYSLQYQVGLFSYQDRGGERLDAAGFVKRTREAGGEESE